MTGSSSDEAAGRLRAAEKASRAYDQYGNRLPSVTVVANADLAEILDEREQRPGAIETTPSTAAAWEVDAYATRYSAYSSGASDQSPGWPPVKAMHAVVAELAAATARAKQAEARLARHAELDAAAKPLDDHMRRLRAESDRLARKFADGLIAENFELRTWLDELGYDAPAVDRRLREAAGQQRQGSEEGTT